MKNKTKRQDLTHELAALFGPPALTLTRFPLRACSTTTPTYTVWLPRPGQQVVLPDGRTATVVEVGASAALQDLDGGFPYGWRVTVTVGEGDPLSIPPHLLRPCENSPQNQPKAEP